MNEIDQYIKKTIKEKATTAPASIENDIMPAAFFFTVLVSTYLSWMRTASTIVGVALMA